MDPDVTVEPVLEPEAPPKRTRRTKREPDRGPFFTAVWQGRAVYRCPVCRIAKTDRPGLGGDAAIRIHLARHHPAQRRNER